MFHAVFIILPALGGLKYLVLDSNFVGKSLSYGAYREIEILVYDAERGAHQFGELTGLTYCTVDSCNHRRV